MADNEASDTKGIILSIWEWIDIVFYSSMLMYALYNSYQFLIVQRLCNFYLTPFYLLTIVISVLRIVYFFNNFLDFDYMLKQ